MNSDEALARSAQSGDRAALAELVHRHHSSLLGYLYRLTGGDRALAEDLVQETFLRVLKNAAQYRYPRRFKPWLYAIATNLARDHYRLADTRRVDTPGTGPLRLAETGEHPEQLLASAADSRLVIRALAGLPPDQRETIILRFYQDLSLQEISEALDVPVGTVKSRLSIGLKRLKTLFDLLGDAPER